MNTRSSDEQKTTKDTEKKQRPRVVKVVFTIAFFVLVIHGCGSEVSKDAVLKQQADSTVVINDTLYRQVGISVTIKAGDGKPLPNKFVNVNTLDGTLVVKGMTNTHGVFERIGMLPVSVQKVMIMVRDNGVEKSVTVPILDNIVSYEFIGIRGSDDPIGSLSDANLIEWFAGSCLLINRTDGIGDQACCNGDS